MNTVFFLLYLFSVASSADPCAEWLRKGKVSPGPGCAEKCSALPTGMDTFSCTSKCPTLCQTKPCGRSEHWIETHEQRGYLAPDGKFVGPKKVVGHCQRDSPTYKNWNGKLREGKPEGWKPRSEQPSRWTAEQRERVLKVLEETPDLLKDLGIFGIYRLLSSVPPGNPAANNYADFVLYDEAFEPNSNLTLILNHELAHRLFEKLTTAQQKNFMEVASWHEVGQDEYQSTRPENQFLRKNDMLSPREDFADDVAAFVHQPEVLKKTAPDIYKWLGRQFGEKLRLRSKP